MGGVTNEGIVKEGVKRSRRNETSGRPACLLNLHLYVIPRSQTAVTIKSFFFHFFLSSIICFYLNFAPGENRGFFSLTSLSDQSHCLSDVASSMNVLAAGVRKWLRR